jgi:hypothetical protein
LFYNLNALDPENLSFSSMSMGQPFSSPPIKTI